MSDQLFDMGDEPTRTATPVPEADAPLAVRMRPRTIDELVGQRHLLGTVDRPTTLRRAIADGRPHSMVLYGPPGTGKTTLARIVARSANAAFEELSAVQAGRAEVRGVIDRAAHRRKTSGEPTVFFLDFTSRRLGVRDVRSGSRRTGRMRLLRSRVDVVQFLLIDLENDGSIGPTRAQSHGRAAADVGQSRAHAIWLDARTARCPDWTLSGRSHNRAAGGDHR